MRSSPAASSVFAIAGRRVDALGTRPQAFPLAALPRIEEAIAACYARDRAAFVVSSAACGADLLALKVARDQGIPFRIVLPFRPRRFVTSSVLDRPGDWEDLYWTVIRSAKRRGELSILPPVRGKTKAYLAANAAILEDARSLCARQGMAGVSLAIWNGPRPESESDATRDLFERAARAGFVAREIRTDKAAPH